ncbi:MAG TPA: hypothetical protein VKX35_05140 [Fermentimonas sp.]|nr:hypothetical protein [Fermentimonas sp.]
MKTIYNDILSRLKEKVPAIKWIDFDTGQLESPERPAVAFPCALISISISGASDITDNVQDCTGRIRIRLAFDQQMRTEASAPDTVRNKSLQPYDIIADVYSALQGFATIHFEPLTRVRQDKENSLYGLFIYFIEFNVEFEDQTAEQ